MICNVLLFATLLYPSNLPEKNGELQEQTQYVACTVTYPKYTSTMSTVWWRFLHSLQEKEPSLPFFITSVQAKGPNISLTVLPKVSGKYLFFPGLLSGPEKEQVLMPAAISVKKAPTIRSLIAPLVPLNVDAQPLLSLENQRKTFVENVLINELNVQSSLSQKKQFFTLITLLLATGIGGALILWIGNEYRKGRKKEVERVQLAVDWEKQLADVLADKQLSVQKRVELLSSIASHLPALYAHIRDTLEKIRFSGETMTEIEWNELLYLIDVRYVRKQ